MTAPLGTAWTKPGEGATVSQLWQELIPLSWSGIPAAKKALSERYLGVLAGVFPNTRTDLALTGHPLTAWDLKRIEAAK